MLKEASPELACYSSLKSGQVAEEEDDRGGGGFRGHQGGQSAQARHEPGHEGVTRRRIRMVVQASDESMALIEDALGTTLNGVAQGLRNTR